MAREHEKSLNMPDRQITDEQVAAATDYIQPRRFGLPRVKVCPTCKLERSLCSCRAECCKEQEKT